MTKTIRNKKNPPSARLACGGRVTVFSSVDLLNQAAAELLIDLAKKSIEERGRFALALSGGNTPKKLYALLSMSPYRDKMPWKDTFIFWSDERCVPMEDERNNANMAINLLLKEINIPPSNIFRVPVQMRPALAAKHYEETLRNFFKNEPPRFDLILLGLGENGHTASLFPGTDVLHENRHRRVPQKAESAWVKEVYVEEEHIHRITMTAPLINKARNILFLVTGEEKSHILKTVMTGSYLPEQYPAQLIDPEQGEIQWFVDEKAASRL